MHQEYGGYTLLDQRQVAAKFQRTYRGEPRQVKQVRDDIIRIFGWCPMAEELILVASELATNAIKHSKSGNGGHFTVTVRVRYGDHAWIDVEDQGDRTAPRDLAGSHGADSSLGKGLAIVDALAGEGNWGLDSLARPRFLDDGLNPGQDAPEHVAWARIPWFPCPLGG
jgi:two-component sensor histidine kinase